MTIDKIIITIVGGGLIALIYWFFFGKREEVVNVMDDVEIAVKGGYKPETIKIKKGKETKITFLRSDPSSCLEEIVIPDFKIRKFLPLNKSVTIKITPTKSGTYGMHCGMNMYHGKIIVS